MAYYPDYHKIEIYTQGAWVDISDDVVSDISGEVGMYNSNYTNRLASAGDLKFDLNNKSSSYIPNENFGKGTKVRFTLKYGSLRRTLFFGYIDDIKIDTGVWGPERVHIACLDWLGFSQKYPMPVLASLVNTNLNGSLTTLLSNLNIQPEDTDIDAGTVTFPSVFDTSKSNNSTVYSELNNLIMSEWGYLYMRDGGMTLKAEQVTSRSGIWSDYHTGTYNLDDGSHDPLLLETGNPLLLEDGGYLYLEKVVVLGYQSLFNQAYVDLGIDSGNGLVNRIEATSNPTRVDTSITILYNFDISTGNQAIAIPAHTVYRLQGNYVDPIAGGTSISAYQVVTPVAGTDISFWDGQAATGTNLTSNLVDISFVGGRSSFVHKFRNTGPAGYLLKHNVRGKAIYKYNPVKSVIEDTTSQSNYGLESLQVNQPYTPVPDYIIPYANEILNKESTPRIIVNSGKFIANRSQNDLASFLVNDIGDEILVYMDKPFVKSLYYIQGIKFSVTAGGIISYTYYLMDTPAIGYNETAIAVEFGGNTLTIDGITHSYLPLDANFSQRTISAWIFPDSFVPSTANAAKDQYGIVCWGTDVMFTCQTSGRLQYYHNRDGHYIRWISAGSVFMTGTWSHVAVTYDASSTTNRPRLYVNGAYITGSLVAGAPVGNPIDETGLNLVIGNADGDDGEFINAFDGRIQDVAIFNDIQSDAQIAAIVNAGAGIDFYGGYDWPNLKFYGYSLSNLLYSEYVNQILPVGIKPRDEIYGFVGTPNGNPVARPRIAITGVKTELAVELSKANTSYIDFGHIAEADTNARSIAFWVYRTESSDFQKLFNLHNGLYAWIDSNDAISVQATRTNTNGVWYTPPHVLSLNAWTHIVVMFDRSLSPVSDPNIYVSAAALGTTAYQLPLGDAYDETSRSLRIGDSSYSFPGKIKHFRIYNRILTSGEIATIRSTPADSTTVPSGLIFQPFWVDNAAIYASYLDHQLTSDMLLTDLKNGYLGSPKNLPYGRSLA